jgi:hypothetical protein
MVVLDNPAEYTFVKFEKSTAKGKKYDALLYNKRAKQYKRIPFGSVDYPQYEDKTGLGLYSHLNTYNKERRRLYKQRHHGEDKNKFSSGWFALRYLW